jgi:hypothetical protein
MPLDTKLSTPSVDMDAALQDPAACFSQPQDILTDPSLSRAQRVRLLQRWEEDAKRLDIATNEGMAGDEESMLQRVKQALLAIEQPTMADVGTSLKTTAKNVASTLSDTASHVRGAASRTRHATVEVRDMIRSQPVTAAAIFFVFGYVVGRMKSVIVSHKD